MHMYSPLQKCKYSALVYIHIIIFFVYVAFQFGIFAFAGTYNAFVVFPFKADIHKSKLHCLPFIVYNRVRTNILEPEVVNLCDLRIQHQDNHRIKIKQQSLLPFVYYYFFIEFEFGKKASVF